MSTTVATSSPAFPRPRRAAVPPGVIHWATWALIVVLVLGPFVPLLEASLRDRPLYEAGGVFTLGPYRDLLGESAFWTAWKNTVAFAALTTAMAVGFGAAFAILCARTDLPGRRAYSRLVLLPILLPALGMVLGWIVIWGPGGYLTAMFAQRLLVGADSSLEDAARSAGARPLKVLGSVTIPMLRPALLNSATLIFTLSIAALGVPLLLGTPNNIQFVSSYLYNTWTNAAAPDPGSVSAGAMMLLLVATALLALRNRLLGAEERFVSVGGKAGRTAMLGLRA